MGSPRGASAHQYNVACASAFAQTGAVAALRVRSLKHDLPPWLLDRSEAHQPPFPLVPEVHPERSDARLDLAQAVERAGKVLNASEATFQK